MSNLHLRFAGGRTHPHHPPPHPSFFAPFQTRSPSSFLSHPSFDLVVAVPTILVHQISQSNIMTGSNGNGSARVGTSTVKQGLAQMLKGGVIVSFVVM